MLSLLLGPDDFSKTEYLNELAANKKADLVLFGDDQKPRLEELIQSDLFSQPKAFEITN